MRLLRNQHERTSAVVQQMETETRRLKWQVQEMQEDNDRGGLHVQERLSVFGSIVDDFSARVIEGPYFIASRQKESTSVGFAGLGMATI